MKIKVSDYVVKKLLDNKIDTTFSVVGGGAMNLNYSFGHTLGMKVYYNHHEQACAIAAEGYCRINNKTAALCLTTGPGGINALTGVAGAYLDSLPMIIISGQVRLDSYSKSSGLNIRSMGDQEFNIVDTVKTMTKYSVLVTKKEDIKYCLEKAIYLANSGRKGPTWIDIPGDIQSSFIEEDELKGYTPEEDLFSKIKIEDINYILDCIKKSKRPLIYAGSAIRTSNSFNTFHELIEKLNVPVVTAWNSTDVISNTHKLYAGRPGNFGDRPGNFAVQNSDLIISLGCRLSIRQTGFNYKSWAPKAKIIMVDIDKDEMNKPSLHIDYKINADVHYLINELNRTVNGIIFKDSNWIGKCKEWINEFPVVTKKHYEQKVLANAYAVIDMLSKKAKDNDVLVSGNGTACVVGGNAYQIKNNSRFIVNSAIATMGYDLPAAFGACIANDKKSIICLTGDGSIQMNLQELQTIRHHKLPIKIIVLNNDGYHSIRQSQSNFFKNETLCGVGSDSFDLSFPDLLKIAYAYDIKFIRCNNNDDFCQYLDNEFLNDELQICEVMIDKVQYFEPKASSKKLANGSMVSAPLEDLAPHLDEKIIEKIMGISK
ncbi:MAG: thiamine pyrophosphate-binding protein [Anaeroplasmataceae bacterium]